MSECVRAAGASLACWGVFFQQCLTSVEQSFTLAACLLSLFPFPPDVVEAASAAGCCCLSPVSPWLKVTDRLQSETITPVFPVP